MTRTASFSQADLARAVRALRDAGIPEERICLELSKGKASITIGEPKMPIAANPTSDWDDVR